MKKHVPLVAVLLLLMASPLMAVDPTVSIPDDILGVIGGVATAPINLDNATDLEAFDFELYYDTNLLDLAAGDIKYGTLTSGWSGTLRADDAAGKAWGNIYGGPLTGGSGSLLEFDFHPVAPGTSLLTFSETYLNESIVPILDSGSITTVPEPAILVALLSTLLLILPIRPR